MKKLLILVVIAFLGFIVVPAAFGGGPKAKSVKIVKPLPLPVTGDVTVNNTEENPVPIQIVDEERRIPFQGKMAISRSGSDDAVITPLDPVPEPDKILTIEFISGKCSIGELHKSFTPALITSYNGIEFRHYFGTSLINTVTSTDLRTLRYVFNQKTTIFADTNYPIDLSSSRIFGGADWPDFGCTCIISGYLKNP